MSKRDLLKEEYVPAGLFIKKSFDRDRLELTSRFPMFTEDFSAEFGKQIEKVKQLESSVVLKSEIAKETRLLYAAANELNREFNFLVYYFKKATLTTKLLSSVKRNLTNRNIEGAVDKIKGVIDIVTAKRAVLVEKGMGSDFPEQLAIKRDYLEDKNGVQNEYRDAISKLYGDHQPEYEKLLDYIQDIADAGKRFYATDRKVGEYTITKLISRMRSGNDGGGDDTPKG
jgi:hypothetical protein